MNKPLFYQIKHLSLPRNINIQNNGNKLIYKNFGLCQNK